MKEKTKELSSALYSAADALRSKMDANEYKDYLLGIVFYKYLSDKLLYYVGELLGNPDSTLEEAFNLYKENAEDQDLQDELKATFSYSIEPQHTYTYLIKEIDHKITEDGKVKTFQISDLADAFKDIESTGSEFDGLFDDVDLYSRRLGSTPQKQADTISSVLSALSNVEIVKTSSDVLGDAYEYLIGQFASETGKKAGEFYTPQQVSELLTRLTLVNRHYPEGMTVYDPAMGSGSLLLNFKKYAKKYNIKPEEIIYYGQEINLSTFNLAKMNMILHGVDANNQHLRNGDTLDEDWPPIQETMFDSVVMNPPYSYHWSANKGFLEDPRFSKFGVLPPKSKADYAFLLHGLYHLKNSGTMAIVLPHGVLFRGGSEGKIRQKLLDSGIIDAVIGLPANLFYNTSIPTCILVLKKDKQDRDVMFIDASKEFEKGKNQNKLKEENITKILDTYKKREDVKRYAHLAKFDEIKKNDFNLNIPRYVDTFVPEPPVDLKKVSADLRKTDDEIQKNQTELVGMLKDLTSNDPKIMDGLNDIIKTLQEELK
ncbi:type I restriction-modification system subunit M [Lactobacillus acetotolerans]|uniref:type I restriction-modification system subunit M n=1 Tax=Lactobacillus acetotolerans TaxID=1600 RepID=UPI0007B955F6|nr:type I restriction-modification system subunit M [Lactobacillus acetotolerans]MBN7276668.1 type I restriction-modification system subunit M [Lactobacillus acetotolerans]QGV04654.1 type I restriction-modification system subunit M [Lactobacillus acetotolerans]QJD73530.1 type I restriction-modification system subunit M [Lactobacillus acetotolerans]